MYVNSLTVSGQCEPVAFSPILMIGRYQWQMTVVAKFNVLFQSSISDSILYVNFCYRLELLMASFNFACVLAVLSENE